jgi:predicted dehydrogenase
MRLDCARVALIGYGYAGKYFHAPLIQAVSRLHLTVVVSSKGPAVCSDLPGVQIYATPAEAMSDPNIDVVVVATPNDTHHRLAVAALRAGKHVVVDKPFTVTLPETREIKKLADETGLLVAVFQNRRWDSDFLQVRKLLLEGRLGTTLHFESHMDRYRPEVQHRWRENPEIGNGLWYDLGPHLIDGALQLFGMPVSVTAIIGRQRLAAQTDDWAHVVLGYERLKAILHCSLVAAGTTPRFIIHGTNGSWIKSGVDTQEKHLIQGLRPGDPGFGHDNCAGTFYNGADKSTIEFPAPDGDYRQFYEQFAEAVLDGGLNPVPPAQAIEVMTILEMAIDSSNAGRTLAVRAPDSGTSK